MISDEDREQRKAQERAFATAYDFANGFSIEDLATSDYKGNEDMVVDDLRIALQHPQAFRCYMARNCA